MCNFRESQAHDCWGVHESNNISHTTTARIVNFICVVVAPAGWCGAREPPGPPQVSHSGSELGWTRADGAALRQLNHSSLGLLP